MRKTYATHEQWLADRPHYVGASEAAALFGAGYSGQGPSTIAAAKINPTEQDVTVTDQMRLGDKCEPGAIEVHNDKVRDGEWEDELAEQYPDLRIVGSRLVTIHDAERPWIACTPDGWLEADGLPAELHPAEVKTLSRHGVQQLQEALQQYGEVPIRYQIQVQHQLLCTDASWGLLLINAGNERLHRFRVERHDQFLSLLVDKLEEFWRYVQRGEIPPDGDADRVKAALAQVHPEDDGTAIELPDDAVSLYDRRERYRQAEQRCKQRKKAAEAKLLAMLKEHAYGELPDGRAISWKTQTRKAHYVSESTSRTVRFLKQLPKGVMIHE